MCVSQMKSSVRWRHNVTWLTREQLCLWLLKDRNWTVCWFWTAGSIRPLKLRILFLRERWVESKPLRSEVKIPIRMTSLTAFICFSFSCTLRAKHSGFRFWKLGLVFSKYRDFVSATWWPCPHFLEFTKRKEVAFHSKQTERRKWPRFCCGIVCHIKSISICHVNIDMKTPSVTALIGILVLPYRMFMPSAVHLASSIFSLSISEISKVYTHTHKKKTRTIKWTADLGTETPAPPGSMAR